MLNVIVLLIMSFTFVFLLRDKVKSLLNYLPTNLVTSYEDLVPKFLSKFFSPAKITRLHMEINNFAQYEGELSYEERAI